MGTSLTGKQIKNTYKSLIKVSDNTEASASAKQLSDGNGNDFGVYIDTDGVLGLGSAPSYSLDISSRTDGVALPVGTTANRPTASAGLLRYNSTIGKVEFYDTGWKTIFTTSGGTISGDVTVTGDLVVQGTTVTLNTETVQFEDNILMLNRASNDTQYNATNAGIELEKTSAANPSFLYTYSDSTWTATDNFKIEGNLTVDTNTLYVDSTNNRVGIGTVSPNNLTHILGGYDSQENVLFKVQSNGVANDGTLSTSILLANSTAESSIHGAKISAIRTGAATDDLAFYTYNVSMQERLRIDSTGLVKIGSGTGTSSLKMVSGTDDYFQIDSTGTITNIIAGNDSLGSAEMSFYTASGGTESERMKIHSGGDISFRDTSNNEAFYWDASAARLGIGTTSPSAILHSVKTDSEQGMFSGYSDTGANGASGKIVLGNNTAYQGVLQYAADGNTVMYIDNTYDSASAKTQFRMRTAGTDVNALTILGSGNVGIGTTASTNSRLNVTSSSAIDDVIRWTDAVSDTGYLGIDSSGGVKVWAGGFLSFGAGGGGSFTERVRIGSSGNVIFKGGGAWADNTGNLQLNWTTNEGVISTYYDNHKLTLGSGVSYKNRIEIEGHTAGNGAIKFYTSNLAAATERMRITSSGNVGIGTTSPSMKMHIEHGDQDGLRFRTANTSETFIDFADPDDNDAGSIRYDHNVNSLAFRVNASERMRITSGGELLINTTSTIGSDVRFAVRSAAYSETAIECSTTYTAGSNKTMVTFIDGSNDTCGSIYINPSSNTTNYQTSSDYRLKEDAQDFDGLSMINNINVYDFKWKKSDKRSYGVFAHELQEVLPQAVGGEKDGKEMQGVDYSKIVPILTKALQEQQEIINDLKARIETLENQ